MFDTGMALDKNGNPFRIHSQISAEFAETLYQTVLKSELHLAVEVGMAFGVSSLAILTAIHDAGGKGRLISIDPDQSSFWNGCGIANVSRAGLQHLHQLVEDFDFLALPRLLESGNKIDFAYIDGWHTFDYTLLDFFYIDKMMNAGGIVGFNDCSYSSVNRVINFLLSHRRYDEMNVGLKASFSRLHEIKRFMKMRFSKRHRLFYQDRYFRKVETWEPNWDFYADF